ncbi:bactofilin family protein [Xanthomonas euvesicatoria]|uniref:Cytoskeletal protein CcmA (Bactofilin family) n=1 Tax=Xanthomonas euvesicatoria TaxID=456327 RepID=A0AAW3U926_XANEU|nr:polymer-forming cytoskeletal protein [Xanthomonas euvesicatoria]MBB4725326.1 cytoskeletal protein CcmA (bactofilin family) [Xanthomonas euvesicatoria]MBB4871918.1 cytoskeletal protein CcmA (bactofilin family) [Xanthomonas euvesicatoria]
MFGNKSNRGAQTVVDTLIGPQVVIRGDLMFSGGLYVEGRILGKVIAEDGASATLTVAEQGSIEGEVRAPVVIINGQLTGDVHAAERVELAANARVQGNVHYQVVEMSAGAQLTGRLIHAATAGATAELPAPEAGRAEPATALQAATADA